MERESSLDERLRKDQEKADAIMERRIRLGHVPAPVENSDESAEEKSEEKEQKPAPKRSSRRGSRAKTVKT
jgi:hypothetical protein